MSIVTDHKETRISSGCLMKLFLEYIPEELFTVQNLNSIEFGFLDFVEDNGEKLLQWIIDNSNQNLRIYGSPQELAANVKIYRNFTACMKNISADIIEPYSTPPTVYRSLTNKEYICKQDLFVVLQDLILKHFPEMECIVFLSMILIYLKSKEALLDSCSEFVQFDSVDFDQLEAEIVALGKDLNEPNSTHFPKSPSYMLKLRNYNFTEIFTQWKKIIPFAWNDSNFNGVQAILTSVIEEVNPKRNPLFFKHRFYNINIIIQGLKQIIDKRPLWFLPYKETKQETPKQMKLYEDYGESFVLIRDVNRVIERASNDQLKEFKKCDETEELCEWQTISYDELKRRFPKQCKVIEFIRTPVLRAKHRAVPIIDYEGVPHIFAADALIELLRRIIFSAKLFQRIKMVNGLWDMIEKFLEDHFFTYGTTNTISIMELIHVKCINYAFTATFRHFMDKNASPVKNVRNAKKDGFTLDNLKNELKHLELTDAFPEITDHAEVVYEHAMKTKKEKYLRTCDLFDALELCQLICVLRKFPKLADFLHSQKCCSRVLYKCRLCKSTTGEASNNKNNSSSEPTTKENIEKELLTSEHQNEELKKKLLEVDSKLVAVLNETKLATEWENKEHDTMELKKKIEVAQLELKISCAEKDAVRMKESREKLQVDYKESLAQLEVHNLQLKEQLEKEEKMTRRLEQEVSGYQKTQKALEKQLEETEKEKTRLKSAGGERDNDELRKKNMRLTIQLEEREKNIKSLLKKLDVS